MNISNPFKEISLMLFIAKLTTYHMVKNQNEILIINEIMDKKLTQIALRWAINQVFSLFGGKIVHAHSAAKLIVNNG